MALRDIRKCNVRGRRVLVRVDYNVDTDARGRLRDLTRIEATVPTVRWLLKQGATVILVTHRGRPQGRDKKLSVRPVVAPLTRLLRQTVTFIDAPILTPAFDSALQRADGKRCILLENIRFESGEEENSSALAKRLASLADVAVNDAFADSHRAHASIVGVAKLMPMFAGLTLQREVTELTALIKRPKRPYVAVIGGAKISTKLHLIQRLLKQADFVLLGGALANTLLQAEGVAIGAS
jgi:3-phosphoglycerate kinase